MFGCKHKGEKLVEIQCYKLQQDGAPKDMYVYYYLIIKKDTTPSYYYYASPSPVTDFSTATWSTSTTLPPEIAGEKPDSKIEESLDELPIEGGQSNSDPEPDEEK